MAIFKAMLKLKKKVLYLFSLLVAILMVLFFLRHFGVKSGYSITPRSVYVGEPVDIKLNVAFKNGTKIKLPDIENAIFNFEKLQNDSSKVNLIFLKCIQKHYRLVIYSPGEYIVPQMEIEYLMERSNKWRSIILPEGIIEVKSVLPDDFNSDPIEIMIGGALNPGRISPFQQSSGSGGSFKKMTGPIRFKILEKESIRYPQSSKEKFVKTGIIIFSGMVLMFCILFFYKIKKLLLKRKLTPIEQALVSLYELKKSNIQENNGAKEYCAIVYNIILLFFRDYFGLKNREMVFEELKGEIVNIQSIRYEDKKYVLDLLRACDDIKYAPEDFGTIQGNMKIERIITFVEDISSQTNNTIKQK